jgi:hypothetical protein
VSAWVCADAREGREAGRNERARGTGGGREPGPRERIDASARKRLGPRRRKAGQARGQGGRRELVRANASARTCSGLRGRKGGRGVGGRKGANPRGRIGASARTRRFTLKVTL